MNKRRQPDKSTLDQSAPDSVHDGTQQQRDQEALRQSEEKYRTLFDSIDEGFVEMEMVMDDAGRVVDWRWLDYNPAFERMSGLKGKKGQLFSQIVPQLEPEWAERYGHVVATGEALRFELPVGGLDSWFDIFVSRIGDEGNRKVVCVFNNITARKRHEANLAFLSEVSQNFTPLLSAETIMQRVGQRLGRYLRLSRCAFSLVDDQADRITTLHEWRREDVMVSLLDSYPISALLTEAGRQHYRTGKLAVIHDTRDNSVLNAPPELLYQMGNAAIVDVPYVQNGRWTFLLTVVRSEPGEWRADETELLEELAARIYLRIEQARAEAALRESEEKFRLLSVASSDTIYAMSPDWTQMHQLMGKSFLADTTDPSSSWLEVYIPPEDQPLVRQAIQEAIRTKSTFGLEHQVLRADGTVGWTFSRAIPILDEQGAIREWLGAASDITARKQMEQALREADQRKNEFLAMLAHELRNPLAPVRNGLQLLAQIPLQDQLLATMLPIMNRQMDHLMRMVDDLLDVSRISRGKIELHNQRMDLSQVVAQTVNAMQPLYTASGRQLNAELPDYPLYLDGDATRLNQVVSNLLSNSLRYTHEGGQVWLRVERLGEQAVLRVRDNGIGLAAHQLEAIFELFVQADTSLARSNGGLGLGLALVRQLVQQHGGRVEAYSPGLEQGSEFVVYLPIQEA